MSNKTIFEMIIDKEIPANIIYEDEDVIAFLDASPIVKGHTLVVPKKPIENIYELDDETGAKVIRTVRNVATAIKDAFQPEGLNVVQNNGEIASQSVFHIHFHIIPRYTSEYDGFGYKWNEMDKQTNEERKELENIIKQKLDA